MTDYLQIDALSKRFSAHGRYAFECISFSVAKGDVVALIGPSGCGKSTLLHIAAGLCTPTSGTVRLKSEAVTSPRPDMMFVFQQYNKSIFPWKTVLDNVMLGVKEECYLFENRCLARGIATCTFDGPGQGSVYALHGSLDRLIPATQVDRLRQALAGNPDVEFDIPSDGDHCCHNLYHVVRPRMADWLAERLGGRT